MEQSPHKLSLGYRELTKLINVVHWYRNHCDTGTSISFVIKNSEEVVYSCKIDKKH